MEVTLTVPEAVTAWVPSGGPGTVVVALLVALLAAAVDRAAGALRRRLEPRGVLPTLVRTVRPLARATLAVASVLAALTAVPAPQRAVAVLVLVFVLVLAAVAARDVLGDLLAGLWVVGEGRLHPGGHLTLDDHVHRLVRLGPRVATLEDAEGRRRTVPYRTLLADHPAWDPHRWPEVTVDVTLPDVLPADDARQRVLEAAALSPWRAPGQEPVVRSDRDGWRVRVRIVGLRHAHDHAEVVRALARRGLEGLDVGA